MAVAKFKSIPTSLITGFIAIDDCHESRLEIIAKSIDPAWHRALHACRRHE